MLQVLRNILLTYNVKQPMNTTNQMNLFCTTKLAPASHVTLAMWSIARIKTLISGMSISLRKYVVGFCTVLIRQTFSLSAFIEYHFTIGLTIVP